MQTPLYAILSDIHGNIDALEAVLADMKRSPVTAVFCLGDMIGYGPEPALCVERIAETCTKTVFGNHEVFLFLADKISPSKWGARIGDAIQLAIDQLSSRQQEWLRTLPLSLSFEEITLSHASLKHPELFRYIFEIDDAETHFSAQKTFISFQGHTHIPLIWQQDSKTLAIDCFDPSEKAFTLREGKRYAVNVGSVGQPRDGNSTASYVLYEPGKRSLLHRRVRYDITRAQKRFKEANLPRLNYLRIASGL